MNIKPTVRILYDSPEAASIQTVTGWVSRHGHFMGLGDHAERQARYEGSTHRACEECGVIRETNGYCRPCHDRRMDEKWLSFPLVEQGADDWICTYLGDRFFQDEEEFYDWCETEDCLPSTVKLVIAEGRGLSELGSEYWCDELAEDQELPDPVQDAMKALNAAIKKCGQLTYWAVDKRVVLPDRPEDIAAHAARNAKEGES